MVGVRKDGKPVRRIDYACSSKTNHLTARCWHGILSESSPPFYVFHKFTLVRVSTYHFTLHMDAKKFGLDKGRKEKDQDKCAFPHTNWCTLQKLTYRLKPGLLLTIICTQGLSYGYRPWLRRRNLNHEPRFRWHVKSNLDFAAMPCWVKRIGRTTAMWALIW